jgi:hypothetical protein
LAFFWHYWETNGDGCAYNEINTRHIHIFFKISNARQCLFPRFARFVNWTLNVKLFCFDFCRFSRRYDTGVISGSQMGSQLLQNTEIIKQTNVLLWKIIRKYGSVLHLSSCIKKLSKRNCLQQMDQALEVNIRPSRYHQRRHLQTKFMFSNGKSM